MNLIVAGIENSSSEVEELRKRNCALELMPAERLLDLLRGTELPALIVDAIVCFIKIDAGEWSSPPTISSETLVAERFVKEFRRLPDSCAMPDGRKWRAIPIVLVLFGIDAYFSKELIGKLAASEEITYLQATSNFEVTFQCIHGAVRQYRQRILGELSNLGFTVAYKDGLYRVGLAMQPTGDIEGFFYSAQYDQRDLRNRLFTVDREPNGLRYEVEQFEALINRQETSESRLQQFFEENPHFLPEPSLTKPLPHVRLEDETGNLLIPDFVIKPIVAYKRDSNWKVLDLKKPNVRLLAGKWPHVRLSHEVTQAITQLRDYGDYFRNPENTKRVANELGHSLRYPRLAVYIGRLDKCDAEELEKAQSREPDVQIVTYDEILERQRFLS